MPWNNGAWWPIYVPEWWSPIVSRHPLDPYSFVHLQTGVICFYVCGYPLWHFLGQDLVSHNAVPDLASWPLWVGFAILLVLSFIFEIIENARCTIEKYREASGTSSNYDGDSYQNIIADLIVVQAGYMISWLFLYLGVPWMSAVWFVVVDTLLVLYMRDSVLMFFNVFLKNKSIIQWQGDGVKIATARQKKNMSIIWPLGAFLKVKDYEETETLPEEVPALAEEAKTDNIP